MRTLESDRSKILGLAAPAIGTQVSTTLVGLVDMFFIGRLGPEALASIALLNTLIWALTNLAEGYGVGLTACIARSTGRIELSGDEAERGRADAAGFARTGILVTAGLSLLLIPPLLASPRFIFSSLNMPHELFPLGMAYWQSYIPFLPGVFVSVAMQNSFRASGDTRTPLWTGIAMNAVNITLDWLLIFGVGPFPELGIGGAAVASGISFCFGAVLLVARSAKQTWSPFSPLARVRWSYVSASVSIGAPATLERFTMTMSQLLVMAVVVSPLGSLTLAAFQITLRLASLSFMPGWGFSLAASTLSGQRLGARDPDGATRLVGKTAKLAMATMGIISFLFIVLPAPLARLFTDDLVVAGMAVWHLRVYGLFAPALGATQVFGGGLRGAGDSKYPMYAMFVSRFLVRLPFAYLLGITFGLALPGVMTAMCLDFFARAFILGIRFYRGRWKTLEIST